MITAAGGDRRGGYLEPQLLLPIEWHYKENQFDTVTRNSFKLMHILANDHHSKAEQALSITPADDDLTVVFGRIAAALTDWDTKYETWQACRATYKSRTLLVTNLLDQLSSQKIRIWESAVSGVDALNGTFVAGSVNYTDIFPNGREPFQKGTMDSRITAMSVLLAKLTPYVATFPAMDAVADAVQAFRDTVVAARASQQNAEGDVDAKSTALHACRAGVALAMYRNLGRLMEKYGADPDNLEDFYELSLIVGGNEPPPEDEPLTPPANLTLTTLGSSNAMAAWDAVLGATGYHLWRRGPGETDSTQVADVSVLEAETTGLSVGEWFFAVSAYNDTTESELSAEVSYTE